MVTHKLRAKLYLTAIWHTEQPDIDVWIDDQIVYSGFINGKECFDINQDLVAGNHCIRVVFKNKKDADTIVATGQDKAVVVDKIVFNDIESEKFIWEGEYRPIYPEPWATEQGASLLKVLKASNYMGWNGEWSLTFTSPIFTWIHNVENLGWIFE